MCIINPCTEVRAVDQCRVTTSQDSLLLHVLLEFEQCVEAF